MNKIYFNSIDEILSYIKQNPIDESRVIFILTKDNYRDFLTLFISQVRRKTLKSFKRVQWRVESQDETFTLKVLKSILKSVDRLDIGYKLYL